MKAICYENTKTTIPNWNPSDKLEKHCPQGYAYQIDGYFVHFYGSTEPLYTISTGLTAIEKCKNSETLDQWVVRRFGATNIQTMTTDVGVTLSACWRPGLYYEEELARALKYTAFERMDEEQALLLLLRKVIKIFEYVEPDKMNLAVFGHAMRELLLLAATEFENQCRIILDLWNNNGSNKYNTNDYIKILQSAHLGEYEIEYKMFQNLPSFHPFKGWNQSKPTRSLVWYHAYNQVKHNRRAYLNQASLEMVLNAIAANIVLYCTRFGPYCLLGQGSVLSGYINQYLNVKLVKPDVKSFYVPLLKIKSDTGEDFFVFDSYRNHFNALWQTK